MALVADVCVVGAGVSGLSTCLQLLEKDSSITICLIEARNRVGGRTESVIRNYNNTNATVDLGGQWLAEEQQVRALRLAKRLNIPLLEQSWFADDEPNKSDDQSGFMSGTVIKYSDEDTKDIADAFFKLETLSNRYRDMPWHEARVLLVNDGFDNISFEQWARTENYRPNTLRELAVFSRTIVCGELHEVSFAFMLWYIASSKGLEQLRDGPGGGQTWKLGTGAQGLSIRIFEEIQRIANQYTTKNNTKGNTSITNGKNSVMIRKNMYLPRLQTFFDCKVSKIEKLTNVHDYPYKLTTAKHLFVCKHVVVTVPPPMYSTITFVPSLPDNIRLFNEQYVMGKVAKVWVIYKTKFWNDCVGKNNSNYNSSNNNQNQIVSNISTTPLEQLGPICNLFPGHFSDDTFALVGLICGDFAVRFTAMSHEEKVISVLTQIKNYFNNDLAMNAIDVIYKEWMRDDYARGGYSGFTRPNTIAAYGDGCGSRVGNMHFAGTETANEWSGYMEGGLESGERAASEILSTFKNNSNNNRRVINSKL